MTSVQNSVHDLSLGMLSHSATCLSNAAGQGFHLNDESRDDDSNAFSVLSSVSVKREAGAPAAEKFDACDSVDVNIRARHRLDDIRGQFQRVHSIPPYVTRELYGTFLNGVKDAALSFYRLNKVGGVSPQNEKSSTRFPFPSAPFQKNRVLIEPKQKQSSACNGEAGSKFNSESCHSIRVASALPKHRDSARFVAIPRLASRVYSGQPFAMSGQLAFARIGERFSFSIGFKKSPPRTPTDRLEAFGSVVRLPLHVLQHDREVVHNHGQVVRRKDRV
jgi:hypothetical protein